MSPDIDDGPSVLQLLAVLQFIVFTVAMLVVLHRRLKRIDAEDDAEWAARPLTDFYTFKRPDRATFVPYFFVAAIALDFFGMDRIFWGILPDDTVPAFYIATWVGFGIVLPWLFCRTVGELHAPDLEMEEWKQRQLDLYVQRLNQNEALQDPKNRPLRSILLSGFVRRL